MIFKYFGWEGFLVYEQFYFTNCYFEDKNYIKHGAYISLVKHKKITITMQETKDYLSSRYKLI